MGVRTTRRGYQFPKRLFSRASMSIGRMNDKAKVLFAHANFTIFCKKNIFGIYQRGERRARYNFSAVSAAAINRKRPALIAKSTLGAAVEHRA